MLLANMSVAALIAEAFPDRALLRRHPAPHQRKMEELAATAAGLVSHPYRPPRDAPFAYHPQIHPTPAAS